MFKRLLEEIKEFESELRPDEEIGVYFASLLNGTSLHIESIDPYYKEYPNRRATIYRVFRRN
jgi:hypothetical protein